MTTPRGTCSVENCMNPHRSKGLCEKHYMRKRRTGSTDLAPPPRVPSEVRGCSVEGCGRPHKAKSFCYLHYARWRATGKPGPVQARPWGLSSADERCKVDGCANAYYASGWCESHYHRARREAKGKTAPSIDQVCAVNDCSAWKMAQDRHRQVGEPTPDSPRPRLLGRGLR